MPTAWALPMVFSTEHFLVGALPVRVFYDEQHRAISAEYPDPEAGRLAIDNRLLSPIELRGEAEAIPAEDWQARAGQLLGEAMDAADALSKIALAEHLAAESTSRERRTHYRALACMWRDHHARLIERERRR